MTGGLIGAGLLAAAMPALAIEKGDLIVRVGATTVSPEESSSLISTTATGALAGTAAHVGNDTQLGLNLVYLYSDNIGVEVLAATPFEHDLSVSGLGQYGFSTTDLGSTKHLPPTVSALYYFGPATSAIRPYAGVGVNYTTFFSESLSTSARTELGGSRLKLDDSFGLSLRAGIDWDLDNNWILNASFWRVDIDTDASFDSALGKVKTKVEIDPYVYMLSVGYKF
ncbi:outer membrane protein OmpW [Gammaproteobacteria bacterium LSUCC0112]|nr:outer membrane protein OmpW [Gammaproteobacteria bacterium LSUCC0112]